MNEVRRHIIHNQIIEVDLPRSQSAVAMQDRIRDCWYDRILPGLDRVFSSLVGEGVIIRIDKLTVDLGPVSERQLEEQLTAKALEAVEKMLKEKLRFEADASDGVSAVPVRKADAEILLYFLVRGYLPWWSPLKDLDRLEAVLMEAGALPAGFSARFLLLIGDPAVMRRLRFAFSRSFLQFLAAGCIPQSGEGDYASAGPAEALAAFSSGGSARFSGGGPASGKFATPSGTTPADEIRQGSGGADETRQGRAGADEIRQRRAEADGGSGTEEAAREEDKAMTNGKVQPISPNDVRAEQGPYGAGVREGKSAGPGAEGIIPPGTGSEDRRAEQGLAGAGSRAEWPATAGDGTGGDKEYRDDEVLYIELAGLVILHPFIKSFFDALGLTEGRVFRDEACLHKAVHLCGFLATGETDIQEQRLILPKLFCGMAWSDPIERAAIITREERMEAENLLTAAIGHWKALKNASPGALREAFLQREGRLKQAENGWQLDVEKKAQDILMGSMPWGISVVKYPWMKALLFVNWG